MVKKLSAEFRAVNADTFLDEEQIAVGAKFEEDILAALRNANELVVMVTPWALQRSYVWLEIGTAWVLPQRNHPSAAAIPLRH